MCIQINFGSSGSAVENANERFKIDNTREAYWTFWVATLFVGSREGYICAGLLACSNTVPFRGLASSIHSRSLFGSSNGEVREG